MKRFIRIVKNKFEFISYVCSAHYPFFKQVPRFAPALKENVHFAVNASRLNEVKQKIYSGHDNWALMQSALDYN